MSVAKKIVRLPEVKREILRLFTKVDIDQLAESDTEHIQKVVGSLINPPALSRDMPLAEEYRQVYALLLKAPQKSDRPKAITEIDLGVGLAEISIVMQAIREMPANTMGAGMRQKMISVLKLMANGQANDWLKLSKSTDIHDMRLYSFLKDSLLRARHGDAWRMRQSPVKRSRKRFWDGGVSV